MISRFRSFENWDFDVRNLDSNQVHLSAYAEDHGLCQWGSMIVREDLSESQEN